MTYLIVRFETLGNVAMTVPVVASLSARYPNDRFIVVAKKPLQDMFYGLPNVQFFEVSSRHLRFPFLLARSLRCFRPDAMIDLSATPRSLLLAISLRRKGVRVHIIEYGRFDKWRMTLRGVRQQSALPSEFERYIRTFDKAGLQVDTHFQAMPVNPAAQAQVMALFGQPERWIGVAPFAKYKSNMLPYRITKEVIHSLTQAGYRVFLFGAGKVECEILQQWASTMEHVTSVAGCLPLCQELELMRSLQWMLCMDSANQHLCSLVGLRAITVWCGTHPRLGFLGWKQRQEDVIQLNRLTCRPCTIHGTNRCRFFNFACNKMEASRIVEKLKQCENK